MPLKDLNNKTVYDLGPEDFQKLFCPRCKGAGKCSHSQNAIRICQVLVDMGVWYRDCQE